MSTRWIVANAAVAAVVLVGVVRLWPDFRKPPRLGTTVAIAPCPFEASLKEVEPFWYEAERGIYHDIPARVLFRLESRDRDRAASVSCKVWAEFERIGAIFNAFSPNSEISRLNQAKEASCLTVSNDFYEVVKLSRSLWKESQGRFDPTVWPLKKLWRDAVVSQRVPDRASIAAVLNHIGFNNVRDCQVGRSIRFDNGIKVDFGGIAKGYAVDRVQRLLKSESIGSGLVQLGGEIACYGPPSGKKWRLGIQHPKEGDGLWGTIANKETLRVSTSGNYRQPLQIGSQSYYHVFDPTTGLPVSVQILGVTTADLSENANNAILDGAATAITVLGVEAGLALVQRLGIEALVLVEARSGEIDQQMTEGFAAVFERKNVSRSRSSGD